MPRYKRMLASRTVYIMLWFDMHIINTITYHKLWLINYESLFLGKSYEPCKAMKQPFVRITKGRLNVFVMMDTRVIYNGLKENFDFTKNLIFDLAKNPKKWEFRINWIFKARTGVWISTNVTLPSWIIVIPMELALIQKAVIHVAVPLVLSVMVAIVKI